MMRVWRAISVLAVCLLFTTTAPAFAGGGRRAPAPEFERLQLRLPLDPSERSESAGAQTGDPVEAASRFAEDPLELCSLSPGIETQSAALEADSDDDAPDNRRMAIQRLEADRAWQKSRRRSSKIDFEIFRGHVERIARVALLDERVFDATANKRAALIASGIRFLRGGVAVEKAGPRQVGEVFRSYYRALKKLDRSRPQN